MIVLAILWLLGNYEATGQSSGIQLKISQHGLNEVVSYLLNYELISSLQEGPTLGDYGFKYGPTQFNVTKLQLHELTGQTGDVTVLDRNKIGVTIGIGKLALQGNITHVAGGEAVNAPNTNIIFLDCRLDFLFNFGHVKEKYGLRLETCKGSVGDFNASGIYGHVLEGIYQLSGQETISSIIEKVCTCLERLTNYRLNDILSVKVPAEYLRQSTAFHWSKPSNMVKSDFRQLCRKDTISISSSTLGDLSVGMTLRSLSTEGVFIVIAVEVITGNEPLLGDLTFPPLAFKQTASDVILSINDELLNKISQLAIQNTTFNELKFEKIINEITYNVQVNRTSVNGTVRSSEDGTCIIWNATLDVQSKGDSCIQFKINMDGIIPFAFNYSDATVLASVDRDRLQVKYEVLSLERTCQLPEANTDMQKDLLQVIHNEFETLLAGKTFSLIFREGKWYGFKDAKLKPMNGGLLVSFGLRVGKQNNENVGRFKSLHHKFYDWKRISFMFTDGRLMEAGIPVTTTASSTTSTTKMISYTIYDVQMMEDEPQRTAASSSLSLSRCAYLVICVAVTICVGYRN